MGRRWTKEEEELLKEEIKLGAFAKDIAFLLERSRSAIYAKMNKLNLKSENFALKTNSQYDVELKIKNPNTIRIEDYINADAKILHKCLVCGTEYFCAPNHKLEGYCGTGKGEVSRDRPAITYLIYFINEDIYKIGVTSNTVKRRMYGMPEYEIMTF